MTSSVHMPVIIERHSDLIYPITKMYYKSIGLYELSQNFFKNAQQSSNISTTNIKFC
jgi:hypothetical protein